MKNNYHCYSYHLEKASEDMFFLFFFSFLCFSREHFFKIIYLFIESGERRERSIDM